MFKIPGICNGRFPALRLFCANAHKRYCCLLRAKTRDADYPQVSAERTFLGERVTYVFDVRMTRLKKPTITSPFVCDQGEPEADMSELQEDSRCHIESFAEKGIKNYGVLYNLGERPVLTEFIEPI